MDTNSRYDTTERFEHAPRAMDYEARSNITRVGRAKAPTVAVECGSGWYHDEAIKDAREIHGHPYSM